jgi:hypothetical protein
VLYELTALGHELEPVVLALGRFGARYLGAPKRGERSHVRWAMVGLKRRYRPGQQRGCIALSVDHIHHYRIRMQSNMLDVAEGPPEPGDDVRANLTADGFRAMLFHDASTRDLLRSGQLVLEGKTKTFFALIDAIGASA